MKPVLFGNRFSVVICTLFLVLTMPVSGRADAYRLQPGDVLSIMIVGAADLQQAVPIEMDGTAWFPIIGEVQAAGATLREIRERVSYNYSVTSFPAASNAENVPEFIQPSQVHVGVAEYQPIYISGELLQPGTIAFRPGLTLRQAIVLAGVSQIGRSGATIVREQVEAVTLNLAQANGRIWSLKTLLGTATPEDYASIFVSNADAVGEIVELEQSLVAASIAERERRRRTIATNTERAEKRLAALRAQRASEEQGRRIDAQIVDDLRGLASRGLAETSRLSQVRRNALSSASRVLELDTTIEEVRTELASLQAEAEAVDTEARSDAWSEISETVGRVHALRAELATLRAAQGAPGLIGTDFVAVIRRRGKMLPPVDPGSTDQDVQPGDLIEIVPASSTGPEG